MAGISAPTGLPLVDGLADLESPTIEDYCEAAAEYIGSGLRRQEFIQTMADAYQARFDEI